MSTPNILKIVQHNLGRSAIASDQLFKYCQDESIDIALLQEPYSNRGHLSGFEVHPLRWYLSKPVPRPGAPKYSDIFAAIVVFNPTLRVTFSNEGPRDFFITIILDNGDSGQTAFTSGYFKYRTPTLAHVEVLADIIDSSAESHLISIDANAFSTRWYSRITDRRGEIVESLIDDKNLCCHNLSSPYTTFAGPRGSTNIDLTLSSTSVADSISNWRVLPDITSSDHRVIKFSFTLNLAAFIAKPNRFCTDRADWEAFKNTISREIAYITHAQDPNQLAASLQGMLVRASKSAIPTSMHRKRPIPPWWSADVINLRKTVKTLSRAKRLLPSRLNIESYNLARNRLTSALRKAKADSWKTFCTKEGREPWGKLYRWLRSRRRLHSLPLMKREDGHFSTSLEESVHLLLNSLIPTDELDQSCEEIVLSGPPLPPVDADMLRGLLAQMAPNKAPGPDLITVKMVRIGWRIIGPSITSLVNMCLASSTFPATWKRADVTIIHKGNNKDPVIPKSYRPVSLLPVLGKLLEKVIYNILYTEISPNLSGLQYGFTKGKSTEDAVSDLEAWCKNQPFNYVLSVFLDISGAFDNIRWTTLIEDLYALNASPRTVAIIRSYLINRTAKLNHGGVEAIVRLTRGCPQGSILGPTLWNVTCEPLLKTEFPPYSRIQAYADDLVISVSADTRAELKLRAAHVLDPVLLWGSRHGLTFSTAKCEALVTKGHLVPGFTINFGDDRIVTKEAVKYLGIWIDQNFTFRSHIQNIVHKDIGLFTRIRGTFGSGWGINRRNLLQLYRAVFLPQLLYGARFWATAICTSKQVAILNRIQRRALLGITSAYRTVSTDALQVLAGVLPLDLEASVARTKNLSRRLPHHVSSNQINEALDTALDIWQSRWESSTKGRWTFAFFPSVSTRLQQPIWMCHKLSQILTGHGNFKAKLAGFALVDSPTCICGAPDETVRHVLFECPRHSQHRARLELSVHRAGHLWPCDPTVLVSSKALFKALEIFANNALT